MSDPDPNIFCEDEKGNYRLILGISIVIIIFYCIYLLQIICHLSSSNIKKLTVFWIDYCFLLLTGIAFIIIYIVYILTLENKSNDHTNNNPNSQHICYKRTEEDLVQYDKIGDLAGDNWAQAIIISLCLMCLTIIDSIIFDALTSIRLARTMRKIQQIKDKEITSLTQKLKNIDFFDLLKIKSHYIYYIFFSVFNVGLLIWTYFAYSNADPDDFGTVITLRGYYNYILRIYHLVALILLIISIIIMNYTKSSLLSKNYYSEDRMAQKIYDVYFSQMIYFTDVLSFKLVSDLIMDVPSMLFLSLARFSPLALIGSEIIIFIFIFVGGGEYLVIDKDSNVGKISDCTKCWFCFRQLNFHFGEKDHRVIFDESYFLYSPEEQDLLSTLDMTIIKNVEFKLIEEDDELSISNALIEMQSKNIVKFNNENIKVKPEKRYLEFTTIPEFYVLLKLILFFFRKNKNLYDMALKNMDENCLQMKKLFEERKTKRVSLFNNSSISIGMDSINRFSTINRQGIISNLQVKQSEIFASFEEKELFTEFNHKFNLNNEDYFFNIESLLTPYFFEIFPFLQMDIRSITSSIEPSKNLKLFAKFIKRKSDSGDNFIIKNINDRISIRNKSKDSSSLSDDILNGNPNFYNNKKEFEKNLFYTYDLFLMYEIYDKDEFINFQELRKIVSEYNKYLISVVKNMGYSFLPLIIGIFHLEIFDSKKIVVVYRNPLYFTKLSRFNHWINFYITEEPEKIKVSSMFNEIININEIEVKNTLELNEADYEEIINNLKNDYQFIQSINNIFPVMHLFIGDEKNDEEKKKGTFSDNILNENGLLNDNNNMNKITIGGDGGFDDIFGKISMTMNNNNSDNDVDRTEINSLYDKEYYDVGINNTRTVKIYFTNLFRKDCELNIKNENIQNKINSNLYCDYLEGQIVNYLNKKNFLGEDIDNIDLNDDEIKKEDDINENLKIG